MQTKPQQYFLLLLIILTGVLSFYILSPFLATLALSVVAAVVFHPLHRRILAATGGYQNVSAFLTILLIALIIIIPLVFVGARLVQEASLLYGSILVSGGGGVVAEWLSKISSDLSAYFPTLQNASMSITEYAEKGLALLLANALPIFSNVVSLFLNTFIFLMALYFLLRDGATLSETLVKLSPLSDTDDRAILESLRLAIYSVITGSLLIALIQAFIATIGFAIFGLPHAILFGAVAAVAALLPGIGTALVDNFLGPRLMGRGIRMHPVLMFLAVIGGLSFFGPFGFIFGPLILSLFFTLSEFFFGKKFV